MPARYVKLQTIVRPLRQGASGPFLATVDLDGETVPIVLKMATARNRVGEHGLLNEGLATLIARRLKVPCPSTFLVPLADSRAILTSAFQVDIVSDVALGFRFHSPLLPLPLRPRPNNQARRLCFLDFVLLNADRIRANPNAAIWKGEIFAFDFGAAMVAPDTPPARFQRLHWSFDPSDHLFFEQAKALIQEANKGLLCGEFIRAVTEARTSDLPSLSQGWNIQHVSTLTRFLEYLEANMEELYDRFRSLVI